MGNWNISIQGVGAHHNNDPKVDADLAAVEFIAKLRSMGLKVEAATFTSGSSFDLLEASKPKQGGVSLFVNGKTIAGFNSIVTYEEMVIAGGYRDFESPSIIYRGARFSREGSLLRGQSIEVVDGTYFSVCHTNRA